MAVQKHPMACLRTPEAEVKPQIFNIYDEDFQLKNALQPVAMAMGPLVGLLLWKLGAAIARWRRKRVPDSPPATIEHVS